MVRERAAPTRFAVIVLAALRLSACKSGPVPNEAGTSQKPDSGLALDWDSACALGTTMGVTKMEPIEWFIPEDLGGNFDCHGVGPLPPPYGTLYFQARGFAARPLSLTIRLDGASAGDQRFRQFGLTKFEELTKRTLGCPVPSKSRQTVLSRGSSYADVTGGRVHATIYDRNRGVVLEYEVLLNGKH